ncbi:MAG TPA: hemolysin-like protein [Rhodospirillaceae bacterium]|nr:hemolysin-like protein [Rhodospirillaceae bacterium]
MISESILAKLNADLTVGSLQIRLAENEAEIDAAQALRYRVFYEEMGATASPETAALKRDFDDLDKVCDHLLVLDNALEGERKVVGTYRLIRREAAEKHGSFYSASEYDIAPLIAYPGEILELGRSCIEKEYRTGTVMNILWKGLAAYMFRHNITLMFGCASLPEANAEKHAIPLSYLYHHHLAPPALRAKALPDVYVPMDILPREAFNPEKAFNDLSFNNIKLDPKAGINSLPPLIKGYLRVGGYIGDGAFLDKQFNTTDVCIIVKTDLITNRYLRHYERIEAREENN